MSETTIFGPPGTGKTTKLIEIVKDRISSGVDPKRIGFFSFSKKAATEARDRASVELGLDTKDMVYFRTLHSLAFQWLGLSIQNVFKGSDYNELGRLVGLDFRTSQTLNIEEGPLFNIGAGGDKYMAVIQMARVKQIEVQMQYVSGWDYDINWQQLNVLDKAYKDYKRVKGKYDFVDMIEKFIVEGTSPEFDLLIIDEAQDLAPLQWSMVKKVLVPNSKEVYYAGDDDQAIYSWMGVDVDQFLLASRDKMILKKSYRVPEVIHGMADTLIKKLKVREEKKWQPHKQKGSITWHRDILDVDLSSGEWLILARTNYIVNKVCVKLKEDGHLFWREGTGWSISPNVLNGIEVWLKLCKNQNVPTTELKNFAKILNPNIICKSGRKLLSLGISTEQTHTLDDIIENCSLNATHETPWQKVLKVSDHEVAYIMSVRRRGERILTGTPRIRISTIHKAKGGEADNVALLLDSTKACADNWDQDSEYRVFYVGMTRAKKSLHLIESTAQYKFEL
jgi:superfamily I DNA/RNA helicase